IVFSKPTEKLLKMKDKKPSIEKYINSQGRFQKTMKDKKLEILMDIQEDIDREIRFMKERSKICYSVN
ncbi:hypothetical protein NSB04_21330, partial [Blautia pseudococcoides]|nr:hypothetical protein [Blautia pseudococcoides]